MFSDINAYIMGSHDPGLLIISGKLMKGVKMEDAEAAINEEVEKLRKEKVEEEELNKIKNKVEASHKFSEVSVLNRAMHLAFAELLGDANDVNKEVEKYLKVTPDDIHRLSKEILTPENCSTLYYYAKK